MKETLTTLKFAERAKKIKNKAVVNEENNEKVFQKIEKKTKSPAAGLNYGSCSGIEKNWNN